MFEIDETRLNRIIERLEVLYKRGDDEEHTLCKVMYDLYYIKQYGKITDDEEENE